MTERFVSARDVAWVIGHGNRYNADVVQLCVDTEKKLGVIINRTTNAVITVLTGMDEKRLDEWRKSKSPNKAERIALAKQHGVYHKTYGVKPRRRLGYTSKHDFAIV